MELMLIEERDDSRVFRPFNITLGIKTPEEARLLWHVLNRELLWSAIKAITDGRIYGKYHDSVAEEFKDSDGIRDEIEKYAGSVK